MRSTQILVVSDRPLMRQGIASVVAGHADMRVIGEMACAAAPEPCADTRPQIVIVDICVPETPGAAIVKNLRSRDMTARLIVLTSSLDERCIKKFIEAGACAVLSTNISTAGLLDTIRGVAAGEKRVDPELTAKLYFDIAPKLSGREVEVLACVAQGHTNSKIAALLGIAAETVKTHLRNLLSKLGASNRTEAVMIAMKRGLLEL